MARRSWAALLRRVFAFDVLHCLRSGGRWRLVGVYAGGERLREVLEGLGCGRGSGVAE